MPKCGYFPIGLMVFQSATLCQTEEEGKVPIPCKTYLRDQYWEISAPMSFILLNYFPCISRIISGRISALQKASAFCKIIGKGYQGICRGY